MENSYYQEQNYRLMNERNEARKEIVKRDERIIELEAEVEGLRNELASIPRRVHNERRAGRKSKITQETVNYVLDLREQNYSFSEIAYLYTQNTGQSISKSTIDRITKMYSRSEN